MVHEEEKGNWIKKFSIIHTFLNETAVSSTGATSQELLFGTTNQTLVDVVLTTPRAISYGLFVFNYQQQIKQIKATDYCQSTLAREKAKQRANKSLEGKIKLGYGQNKFTYGRRKKLENIQNLNKKENEKNPSVYFLKILSTLFVLMSLFSTALGKTVEITQNTFSASGNLTLTFKPELFFCSKNQPSQIFDLTEEPDCDISKQEIKEVKGDIYEIDLNLVKTTAIKCFVKKRINYYTHYFFGAKKRRIVEKIIKPTYDECFEMFRDKLSYNKKKLVKVGNTWTYKDDNGPSYTWPTTVIVVEFLTVLQKGKAFWQPPNNFISTDLGEIESCALGQNFCGTHDGIIIFEKVNGNNVIGEKNPWKKIASNVTCLEMLGHFSCNDFSILNTAYQDKYLNGYGGPGTRVLVPKEKTDLWNDEMTSNITFNSPLHLKLRKIDNIEKEKLLKYKDKIKEEIKLERNVNPLPTYQEWYSEHNKKYQMVSIMKDFNLLTTWFLKQPINPSFWDLSNFYINDMIENVNLTLSKTQSVNGKKFNYTKIFTKENPLPTVGAWYQLPLGREVISYKEGKGFNLTMRVPKQKIKYEIKQKNFLEETLKMHSFTNKDAAQLSALLHGIDINFQNLKKFSNGLSKLLCEQFKPRTKMLNLLATMEPHLTSLLSNQIGTQSSVMGELAKLKRCSSIPRMTVICDPNIITKNGKCADKLILSQEGILLQLEPITHELKLLQVNNIAYRDCMESRKMYKIHNSPLQHNEENGVKNFVYYDKTGCKFHSTPAATIGLKIKNDLNTIKFDIEREAKLLEYGIKEDVVHSHEPMLPKIQQFEDPNKLYKRNCDVFTRTGNFEQTKVLYEFRNKLAVSPESYIWQFILQTIFTIVTYILGKKIIKKLLKFKQARALPKVENTELLEIKETA